MKTQFALIAVLFSLTSAAHALESDSVKLCPKYQCSASTPDEGSSLYGPNQFYSGEARGNTLAEAKARAILRCSNSGGGDACEASFCTKYHGPQIPIFSKCRDQWPRE